MLTNKRTSIAAGGLLGLAVGYSLGRRSRNLSARAPAKPGRSQKESPPLVTLPESLGGIGQESQELDGGVSARPTAHLHDDLSDHYDAVNYDNLGAEYLTRATQAARREVEPESLDLSLIETDLEAGSGAIGEASYNAARLADELIENDAASNDALDGGSLGGRDAMADIRSEELRTR